MHLPQVEDDLLARAEDPLQDESAEDKEVSVYALDGVQSILEVAQHHFNDGGAKHMNTDTLRVMHCS